jgi:L-alanine-DL-glutamate epimerase-like enolase superfamily enzyme
VRAAAALPIAAGENDFALPQFALLARSEAVDILQPNIARAGGVSGLMAIDAICARHGLSLAPHGVGSAVAVAAAVHACRASRHFTVYEANRLMNPLRDTLAEVPIGFEGGAFVAGDRVGHGVEPRADLLARYRWTGADTGNVDATR